MEIKKKTMSSHQNKNKVSLTRIAEALQQAESNGQLTQVASLHRKEVSHLIESFQELVRNLTSYSSDPSQSMHPALRALHMVWSQHDVCLNAYRHK